MTILTDLISTAVEVFSPFEETSRRELRGEEKSRVAETPDEDPRGDDSPLEELYVTELDQVPGIGTSLEASLREINIATVEGLAESSVEEIAEAEGIAETRAEAFKHEAEEITES